MKSSLVATGCLVLGLVVGLAAGFFLGRATTPAPVAVAPPPPVAPAPPSDYPSASEIAEYLDGKSIALTPPDAPDKPRTHTMRKGQIEAVQVGDSASSINGEPWSRRVTFLLDTGQGRYAVDGRVQYRQVGEKFAFFGFTLETVVMQ